MLPKSILSQRNNVSNILTGKGLEGSRSRDPTRLRLLVSMG